MAEIYERAGKKEVRIRLTGRIDSVNAGEWVKKIEDALAGTDVTAVTFDAKELEYVSSAGLRVLLRIKKKIPDIKITDVRPETYEIFEMTGFTEMMTIEKAFRSISVEGCDVIGEGYNGKVYRIDQDNVVKVYKNPEALPEIRHEREVARLALILGVPTAIPFDVVKVGDGYGSVFELLDTKSFAKILAEEPERMDWCVKEYAGLIRKMHEIVVPKGKLPSAKEKALAAVRLIKDALPEGYGEKLERMMTEIPESDHLIHGDYHTKNIVLSGGEVLLIDMDTLSVGCPIFELAQAYNAYVGFSEFDPGEVLRFQGYDAEVAGEFWRKSLKAYYETDDEAFLRMTEDKISCVGHAFLISWSMDEDNETHALWIKKILELLDRLESLII